MICQYIYSMWRGCMSGIIMSYRKEIQTCSVEDPGFPVRGGGQNHWSGNVQHGHFLAKCMRKQKNWVLLVGGCMPTVALGSANGVMVIKLDFIVPLCILVPYSPRYLTHVVVLAGNSGYKQMAATDIKFQCWWDSFNILL